MGIGCGVRSTSQVLPVHRWQLDAAVHELAAGVQLRCGVCTVVGCQLVNRITLHIPAGVQLATQLC